MGSDNSDNKSKLGLFTVFLLDSYLLIEFLQKQPGLLMILK